MKIKIGLMSHSPVWAELLRHEGVPYGVMTGDLRNDEVSVLIVNRLLTESEQHAVEEYLAAGGAILGYARHILGVAGTAVRPERIDYLLADQNDVFADILLIDLSVEGFIPREANVLRTQANTSAAFAGELRGGAAVILPFDVEEVMTDIRFASKNFYSRRERLPSERVSLAGKGEVRYLLHRALEYLHHVRGIPYARLWDFPDGQRSLLALRIDTDGAPQADVDDLYRLARDAGVGMSWYLHVQSHESWLSHFRVMVNQEIGLHCYEHQVFPTYEQNLAQLTKAKNVLEAAGMPPAGFTAPFGIWTPELGRAIDALGFAYSSEFSLVYDAFPMRPIVRESVFRTLQVPIHPICVGSLRRVGYTEGQMKEYFGGVIEQKVKRNEPLFFYHHPTHHSWDVIRFIVDAARKHGVEGTTLGEYAAWWKGREEVGVSIAWTGPALELDLASAAGEHLRPVWLWVSRPSGEEACVPMAERIELSSLGWSQRSRYVPAGDLRRIREFDLRGTLGDVYTRIARGLP